MLVKYKKAPGQLFLKRLNLRQRSWLNALGGAVIFGLGQSLFVVSWIKLYQGLHQATWAFMVILGLAVSLAGLFIMGKSLVLTSQIKTRKYFKKRNKALLRKRANTFLNENLTIEKSPKK